MNWLRHWLGPRLDAQLAGRVNTWLQLPAENLRTLLDHSGIVSVDVETSGLNVRRDRLISIGAVEILRGRLVLGRGFHGILRQEQASSRENVLVHGIGHEDQATGDPPAELLMGFLEYVGRRPLIAFHAPFDREFLRRACRTHLGIGFDNPFLDLADLLPGLFPRGSRRQRNLDEWLQEFAVSVHSRHSADADALATAELFLVALSHANRKGLQSFHALQGVAEDHARRSKGH